MEETKGSRVFHENTPLVQSEPLSQLLASPVWLKMDALQPSGSFKIRGIGLACSRAVERGAKTLVCSSGGNAGYAVAYAGRLLGVPVTVVVPSSTPAFMMDKIRQQEATVVVHGKVWNEADAVAREMAKKEDTAYIPPFDLPDIWEGHSSIVEEIRDDFLRHNIPKPAVVVCVVGGGGLLCGVAEGLQKAGWKDVPILAVETQGAHSFHAAVTAGQLVSLTEITSVAKTLGALQVAQRAFEWASEHPIQSCVVSDAQAVEACIDFYRDHQLYVEPSCGAGLAVVYNKHPQLLDFMNKKQRNEEEEPEPQPQPQRPVLVIVCGGNAASQEYLEGLRHQLRSNGSSNNK
ncbi:L-serine ammonia-lyase [Balamuthia mandrillaris]